MVEGTDTGWVTVLEKKGLHQVAGILENYGIDIFNLTYNDDQKSAHADYIELSIQSQFNKRSL